MTYLRVAESCRSGAFVTLERPLCNPLGDMLEAATMSASQEILLTPNSKGLIFQIKVNKKHGGGHCFGVLFPP